MVAATVDGVDLVLGQTDSRVWAIEDLCSHAGCAFSTDGDIDRGVVICDCHGSEFDVFTGRVLQPPASEPVRTFSVRRDGDVLEIEL